MRFPEFHLELEHDVRNICNAPLAKFGISYFNFGRMFDDGSCYLLSNKNSINQYLFETESPLFAPIPVKLLNKKFAYLIPQSGEYQKVMHDVRCFFDLAHGFDLFECHEKYIDVCCFGSGATNDQIINSYFNIRGSLENFLGDFKEKVCGLFKKLDNHRIFLPHHMQLNFKSPSIILNDFSKRYYLSGNYKHIYFTRREIDCLRKFVLGSTVKETAKSLGLSPKTTQEHADNVKCKLGVTKKSEMINAVLKNGLKDLLLSEI